MSGTKILCYVMSEHDSINIDTPIDWALAEQILTGAEVHADPAS